MELSKSDIELVYNTFARIAIDIIDSGEEVTPQLFFISLDNSERQPEILMALHPGQLNDLLPHASMKAKLMRFVQQMLTEDGAKFLAARTGVRRQPMLAVFVDEAWMSQAPADATKEQIENMPRPSEDPNRIECLTLLIHTPHYSYSGFSKITTDEQGKRHCELEPIQFDCRTFGGVLTVQGEEASNGLQ